MPLKATTVRRNACRACETLPVWVRRTVNDLLAHITVLDERIDQYDARIKQIALADDAGQRSMQLLGIGQATAKALTIVVRLDPRLICGQCISP